MKQPWINPSDAPVIEQSIHDYIVSVIRAQKGPRVEIVPISPGAEATRGWDAAVVEAVPLFFQYKLPDFTSRPAQFHPRAYRARKEFGFNDESGFFHFSLRKKATKVPKSQHELMLEMEESGYPTYYVSTVFIDQSRLRFGGELHDSGRPWISREHYIRHEGETALDYIAPWFKGLICIPPFKAVSAPVERHKFIYNDNLEVSLHSEPTQARAVPLTQVIFDQAFHFGTESSINNENVGTHIDRVLLAIAGGAQHEKQISSVKEFYDSLQTGSEKYRNSLMGQLRPMAQVVKALTGIDVFFTVRLKHRRPIW